MNNVFYINISPVIFRLGPLTIGWYGLMVALAVVTVVAWLAWQNSKSRLISYDTLFMTAIVGIPSGIIIAKLLHIIDAWSYYIDNPAKILSGQGLTIWGAVLGATLGIWTYSRISRQFRFPLYGDMIAPGIILAQAIGRVGCTFNGCCYGIAADTPVSIVYTDRDSFAPLGIPVLPTQVFEIFYNLIVFGVLLLLKGHFKKEGSLFYIYLFLYAAWRFGIDFIRDGTPFFFGLHEAQFIGLVVMLITLPLIFIKNGWVKKGQVSGTPAITESTNLN
jgi:phosphatidylglycerol---prolipoprotein diacylglyceryl transferase